MGNNRKRGQQRSRRKQQPSGNRSGDPQRKPEEQQKQQSSRGLASLAGGLSLAVGLFTAYRSGEAMIEPLVGLALWLAVAGLVIHGVNARLPVGGWRIGILRAVVAVAVVLIVYSLWQIASPHGDLTIKDVIVLPVEPPPPGIPLISVNVNIGYENTGQKPLTLHSYGFRKLVPVSDFNNDNKRRDIENDAINELRTYGDNVEPNVELRLGRPSHTTAPIPMSPEQYRAFKNEQLLALVLAKFRYRDWWPVAKYAGYCAFVNGKNGAIFLCHKQPYN